MQLNRPSARSETIVSTRAARSEGASVASAARTSENHGDQCVGERIGRSNATARGHDAAARQSNNATEHDGAKREPHALARYAG